MKRINFYLFVTMAMLMLSISSAWAQYVKVTTENGTVSWIRIYGNIENMKEFVIYKNYAESAFEPHKDPKGSIDLNEVWSESGGKGTHYQVTRIANHAFYNCRDLTSVVFPSSVWAIADRAFYGCSGLTSVVIPSSVTSIDYNAFYGCSGLTSIAVESGNSVYDSRDNCNAIIHTASNTLIEGCKNTKIPSSVTSIGGSAFHGCSGLTSIEIPSSVTSIENRAFMGCSDLTSVVIPSSVISIDYNAFYGCSGLTSITSYITDVFETGSSTYGSSAFSGCYNATLYVPKGLASTYRSTSDWNRFNKIVESIALAMSCNNKGKVMINGGVQFTNDVGEVSVYDGMDNTFIFQPNNNCELRQVLIDGLDVTLSVENNKLTTKVNEGSKMIVMFDKSGVDVNGDGIVNISDVVALVNLILGQ